jgi:4'-phosphopantetheinyl transferase
MDAEEEPVTPPLHCGESLPETGEVHVWRASLSPEGTALSVYESGLSGVERERAAKFHSRADAEKFIAAHGALRVILGAYAGMQPRELMFSRSAFGKPSLMNEEEACTAIRFNMADSGDVALVAVSRGREIGVDIECMKVREDLSETALRCFCGAEMDLFRAAPPERRADVFYTFWSRKEAYIKARGEGMSLGLTNIDVSLPHALLDRRWTLEDLTVDPGYRGAVVLEGSISRVIYRMIPPHGAGAPA